MRNRMDGNGAVAIARVLLASLAILALMIAGLLTARRKYDRLGTIEAELKKASALDLGKTPRSLTP